MTMFECWGGPLCGVRSEDPDAIAQYAMQHHRGWYERWHAKGKHWMVWRDRTRAAP
jgi:hypothetical protein